MAKKTSRKPHVKVKYVIFCDDIRTEANGKAIFIGVYHGAALYPSFPVVQTLSVWMHLEQEAGGAIPIRCRVLIYPGAREAGRINLNIESMADNKFGSISLAGLALMLGEPGYLTLEMAQYDEEFVEVARLEFKKVDFVPSPTGALQPSLPPQTVVSQKA